MLEAFNSPDYKCRAYQDMSRAWKLVQDVAGGTQRLRDCGTEYLPKELRELTQAYNLRLNRSVLFNAYRKTRDALVGMVFKSNPQIGEDVPEIIVEHLENIDLAGSHLDVFAKDLLTDAFEGHAFILVDADRNGSQPYWVRYRAGQALNWRLDRVDGETRLVQITFEEVTYEAAGLYGEEEVTRYRVFTLGEAGVEWKLFRRGKDGVMLEDEGQTSLARIPVAVVYGRKLGMLKSEPPLLDLAYLNISHYQKYSDYNHALHVADVPILFRKGFPETEGEEVVIGLAQTLDGPTDSDAKWIEHEGKAIGATRQELVDLEQRMALLGLSILSQRSDSEITATEKRIDFHEQSSELATIARSLQDALELALEFHADYLGLPESGSIKLGVESGDLVLDGTTISALSNAVEKGQLTLDSFLAIMQRGFPDIELQPGQPSRQQQQQQQQQGVVPTQEEIERMRESWITNAPEPARELFQRRAAA